MERPTCATCVHFVVCAEEPEDSDGWCKYVPPVFVKAEGEIAFWSQPGVHLGDSCSRHDQFPRYLATLDEGRHSPETMP